MNNGWPIEWTIPPQPITERTPFPVSNGAKLPPMNCIKCDYLNEYVGVEHLDQFGRYVCRSCRGTK